jgi:hypothetical protein
MNTRTRDFTLLAIGLLIGGIVAVLLTTTKSAVSQADSTTERWFNTLLAATAADDYDQFVSVADEVFRGAITPTAFHSMCQSLAPRMQRGCEPTYLGQLGQNGAEVSLWRLTFADGGDDRLARMSVFHGRVNGFLITPAF